MDVLELVYTITIGPLKLLFEAIFNISNNLFVNPGLSIVCLSFALNIILLPLYNRADKIQAEENDIQLKLKDGVDHIKKSFKGDEQYMILQAYYRQNNYKPIYALRSLTSLLLQIPFFIAAASFLSNLKLLNNQSFYFINDLGAPDKLLFGLNILPIAMTIINIVNCIIYTKKQPLRSKIQLYLMAIVFLVLLYNSPSGLSLYYLLNNMFSLIKNIILKIKNKKKFFAVSFILTSIICSLFVTLFTQVVFKAKVVLYFTFIVMFFVGLFLLFGIKIPNVNLDKFKFDLRSFIISTIFLCLLLGLFIPAKVLSASPEEFIDVSNYINPVNYIWYSLSLSFGTFILWFNIYYSLMNKKVQKIMSIILCAICFVFLIDYLFFGTNLGTMSNTLTYDSNPNFSVLEKIINIIVVLSFSIVVLIVWKRKQTLLKVLMLIMCITFVVLSSIELIDVNKISSEAYNRFCSSTNEEINPEFTISKNGENVIVFMLDRAISAYFPYIIEERPELKEQFSGFTYYPNTISFGGHTNFSTPSLFGGYEYTPDELNKRNQETLEEKHNEALLVMPTLFDENGYDVTVCDPPYAGYNEIPDLSIFDEYLNIDSYITEGEFYINEYLPARLKRNLFCFGIVKCSPLIAQHYLYNQGLYLESDAVDDSEYQTNLSVLKNLINMTKIVDDSSNNFLDFQNSTTHCMHVVCDDSTNFGKESGLEIIDEDQRKHYFSNISSLSEIGKWFEYLKENDVYDNTRIILCSDHGHRMCLFPELVLGEEEDDDLMIFNPLLLVKDFNSVDYTVDESFMTLADIPYLATDGVIENPTNLFTGKSITKENKKNKKYYVIHSEEFNVSTNNGTSFIESKWYSIHDDWRDVENWTILDDID